VYQDEVRPLAVVPGDHPFPLTVGPEEAERGHLGTIPADEPLERWPFLVNLTRSGERGAPLTIDRRLIVLPTARPGPDLAPAKPATELTKLWPWIFPPGAASGEYPIVSVDAPTVVAAGATVNLITLAELPRGMAGVIKAFGQAAADFTNLFWTILIKGRPADPIIGINFQFGQLFQPVPFPVSGIPLGPGDDTVLQVLNTGAAGVAGVRARLDLYWWRL
jgi:hypothetical protein